MNPEAAQHAVPARRSWRAWPLVGFYLLAAPAALGGGLALAPLNALAGLILAPYRQLRAPGPAMAVFFLFLGWVGVSCLWSPEAGAGAQGAKVIAACLLGLSAASAAARLDEDGRRLVRASGAACVLVLAALCCFEAASGLALNRLAQPDAEYGLLARNPGKGVSVLAALCFPVIAALAGGSALQRRAWRLALVLCAAASLQFDMNINAIALAAGACAYLAAYLAPRLCLTALGVATGAWTLLAPLAVRALRFDPALLAELPLSWQVRLEIWRFAGERIGEHPVFGWGLNSARLFKEERQLGEAVFAAIPLHPHSVSLHLWLETGAIGAGLAALALALGGWRAGQALAQDRFAAAGAAGAAAAILVTWNVSYGAWQEWWIAAAFAAATLAAARARPRDPLPESAA